MTVFVWLAVALAAGFVFVAVAYKRRWMWTGFLGHPNTPRDHAADRPKMLWDWLDLLLVPVVLAGAGAFINFEQSQREAKHAEAGDRLADAAYLSLTSRSRCSLLPGRMGGIDVSSDLVAHCDVRLVATECEVRSRELGYEHQDDRKSKSATDGHRLGFAGRLRLSHRLPPLRRLPARSGLP
jgi:hypothetical protein